MKLFKVLKYFISGFSGLLIASMIFQFAINTKYTFPEPHAFRGSFIYNPYSHLDNSNWRAANFHAHNLKIFENEESSLKKIKTLDSLYNYLGYSIINISDYQFINLHERSNNGFVPVYEHGFEYYKNHALVLNASKVNWHDFLFRQTLDNKQFIIDQLKSDPNVLVTLVHPVFRNAYSSFDLKYLSNYDCMEIANSKNLFTSCYDTVLSAGHPVFLMADDDTHDINNIKEVGSSYNLLNTSLGKDSIINALRVGRSVAVKLNNDSIRTKEQKKVLRLNLPKIEAINFLRDTISIRLNKKVNSIRFIGQNGTEKMKVENCASAKYFFSKRDTYIRTEVVCNNGTVFFLNPFFRYNGIELTDFYISRNILKTWIWRSIFLGIISIIASLRFKSYYLSSLKKISALTASILFMFLFFFLLNTSASSQSPGPEKDIHAISFPTDPAALTVPAVRSFYKSDSIFSFRSRKGYLPSLLTNFGEQVTFPARFDKKDWIITGSAIGITAALIHFDNKIDNWATVQKKNHGWVNKSSPVITQFGSIYGISSTAAFGVISAIFKNKKGVETSLLATQALITSGAWVQLIKHFTGREDPDASYVYSKKPGGQWWGPFAQYDQDLPLYKSVNSFDAFPSGHAAAAFSMATVFATRYKDIKIVPVISYSMATLVGISRMTEHAHWASDVFVGALIGYACGKEVVSHFNDLHNRHSFNGSSDPRLRPQLTFTGDGNQVGFIVKW